MTHEDRHAMPGRARARWRVGSVVVAVTLLAVACTGNGDGTRGPRAEPSPPPGSSAAPAQRAAPSPPPATGLRGLIAYSTQAGDIWVMNADGSNRRQVTRTRDPAFDFDPSLSPDGRRVVFRTSRGRYGPDPGGIGAEGIFVIDVATRKERQIQPPQGGLFPAWSPDGKTIAFSGTRGSPYEDGILLMNPDGTNVRDIGLPTGGNECATWSPDSSKLAFCHHGGDGNWAVWTVNADGSDPRQLTHPTLTLPRGSGGDSPGPWSPDGKRLAFGSQRSGNFDVFVMNADGSGQHQLTHAADGESPAAWLPDGRIVYASFHGGQPLPSWYLMNPDGTGVRTLPQLDGAGDPIDWLATAG